MNKIAFLSFLIFSSFFLVQKINAQTADEKYFAKVDHYRYLLKEDKKAVKEIYETQLIEADDYFSHEIAKAEKEEEKERWEKAYEETRSVIYKVYKEELANLQDGFDKAMERLKSNYNASKQKAGKIKRG